MTPLPKPIGPADLKLHHVYRLEYKIQSGNYRWYRYTAIMTYLGSGESGLSFNLRPHAGTQVLPHNCLLIAEDLGETSGRSDQRHRMPTSLGPLKRDKEVNRR